MPARKRNQIEEDIENLKDRLSQEVNTRGYLEESIAELETQLQEQGWIQLFGSNIGKELSKSALDTLYDLARLYWLKNPLIRREVEVQALYVFGQGMEVKAQNDSVDVVVQRFLKDQKNQSSLTSHQAWIQNERELKLSGNLFVALITDPNIGRVTARCIPLYEIVDIITNPEDRNDPWYYKRAYMQATLDPATGMVVTKQEEVYHPDWRYTPAKGEMYQTIGSKEVLWEQPVYHLKTNCLGDMKFGVPEVYSELDWAKAYKRFLENWSKLVEAYARFAFSLTSRGGKQAISAAKQKIQGAIGTQSDLTSDSSDKGRPTASIAAMTEGMKLETIRTQGATTSADDARRLMLMISSGSGIPEQILTGDPSTGNLATAKAMERPLELQFRNRQQLWIDTWNHILQYVVIAAAKAPNYKGLDTIEYEDPVTGEIQYFLKSTEGTGNGGMEEQEGSKVSSIGEPIVIDVTFPPLLEHDVLSTVQAIKLAATLDGQPLAGTMDLETVSREMMQAIQVDGYDEMVDEMFPEGSEKQMQTPFHAQQQQQAADAAQLQADIQAKVAQANALNPDAAIQRKVNEAMENIIKASEML
jgi:hypothetical protein